MTTPTPPPAATDGDREALGKLVRETWVKWAYSQSDWTSHPNWILPWEQIDERDREVDRLIGEAVRSAAVSQAVGALEKQLAENREAIRLLAKLETQAAKSLTDFVSVANLPKTSKRLLMAIAEQLNKHQFPIPTL